MLRLFVALVYLGVVFGESSTQASTANGMTPTATTNATTAPVTTNATSPPSTTNATTLPVTTNATTLPVTTNATTLPVTTNATTLPVTTNATTLPVTTNTTTLPVTTNTTNATTPIVTTNATTTPIVTTNATTTPVPTKQTTTRPPYGTYFIKNGDKYCLLAQFEAKFTINYMQYVKEGNKSNTTKAKQGTVVLDSNAKVNVAGSCGMLILTWNKTRPHYTLSIEFGRPKKLQASGDSSFTWWLSRVSFLANLTDNPEFPNATVSVVNASYTLFQNNSIHGTNGSYYYCKKDTKFTLKAKSKDNQVQADFTDWKVEPFVEKSEETDFGSGKDCYQDHPTTPSPESKDSDIVPIAVGCALAGLVLIVLIAYVIGRRKSHRGYEKV